MLFVKSSDLLAELPETPWIRTSRKCKIILAYCHVFCKCFEHLLFHLQFFSHSSRGGENWTETDVKLACKTVFVQFSTSGGRPMLLVRHSRTRRCPPWIVTFYTSGVRPMLLVWRSQTRRCPQWTATFQEVDKPQRQRMAEKNVNKLWKTLERP